MEGIYFFLGQQFEGLQLSILIVFEIVFFKQDWCGKLRGKLVSILGKESYRKQSLDFKVFDSDKFFINILSDGFFLYRYRCLKFSGQYVYVFRFENNQFKIKCVVIFLIEFLVFRFIDVFFLWYFFRFRFLKFNIFFRFRIGFKEKFE